MPVPAVGKNKFAIRVHLCHCFQAFLHAPVLINRQKNLVNVFYRFYYFNALFLWHKGQAFLNLYLLVIIDNDDQYVAQLEAKAGLTRPILFHAILETAQGMARVEEIALASPRMQGISLGPADLAADRKMKTTRVGGGHPFYRVLEDPHADGSARANAQQDLWHYTIARMVDACRMAGINAFYGPFGDISDLDACEQQFRNAFLLGCAGAWSLHPNQIAIAKRVFSPDPEEVKFARKILAAMPDGTGVAMIDGKMQDDATWKQAKVISDLADLVATKDPDLAAAYAG